MGVEFNAFRATLSFEEWNTQLTKEIEEVYHETPEKIFCVTYSTADNINTYASEINARVFEMVKAFDEAGRLVEVLQVELQESVRQHDENEAARDPEKKLTRKERKQQTEEKAHIRDVKKRLAQSQYDVACLQQKLTNIFKMARVRVAYAQK